MMILRNLLIHGAASVRKPVGVMLIFPSQMTKRDRVRQTVAVIAGHHAQQAAERKIGELTTATVK